jgi:hypothetical protein
MARNFAYVRELVGTKVNQKLQRIDAEAKLAYSQKLRAQRATLTTKAKAHKKRLDVRVERINKLYQELHEDIQRINRGGTFRADYYGSRCSHHGVTINEAPPQRDDKTQARMDKVRAAAESFLLQVALGVQAGEVEAFFAKLEKI